MKNNLSRVLTYFVYKPDKSNAITAGLGKLHCTKINLTKTSKPMSLFPKNPLSIL